MVATKYKLEKLIFILLILFFSSCNEKPISKFMSEYFQENYYNPEIIKKEKVKTRIMYEIPTETNQETILFHEGKMISRNKIRSINYFDENGLCYLITYPKYVMQQKDTTGQPKPITIGDIAKLIRKVETNLPNGYYDSTFCFFDRYKRLVKKETHKSTELGINYIENIQTYTYDKMNNLIQISNENNNTPSFSQYFNYTYDDKGRIISLTDSSSENIFNSNNFEKQTIKYSYNSDGLLATEGNLNYVYNEKGLVIERFNLENNNKTSYTFLKYDNQGKCVKIDETFIFPGGDKNAFLTIIQYDEKGLIKDKSLRHTYKNNKGEYTLHKFEYTY